MQHYTVSGMSCDACRIRVEKAVRAVPGVESCTVNLLTNDMDVAGDVSDEMIISAVEHAGYGAYRTTSGDLLYQLQNDEPLRDSETFVIVKRLLFSCVFLIPLMYLSMGHSMFGWPVPSFLDRNPILSPYLQMFFAAIVMIQNRRFFISGAKGVFHRSPNMDTLVSLGSVASFVYSAYVCVRALPLRNDREELDYFFHMNSLFFESAAMILVLITIGKFLEAKSKARTTDALTSLLRLSPRTAVILTDAGEKVVPVSELNLGDRFVIRPGDRIPADGIVEEGCTVIDESVMTGESMPVVKNIGDSVCAATVNGSGHVVCRATGVGEDTAFSAIVRIVKEASATKAPISRIADRVSGVFVPSVVAIAIITFVVWLCCGQSFDFALARSISVLVISCPCALGLATPVAIMVGSGVGAKYGLLFKSATALEETGKAQVFALDKTGTLTCAHPVVTDIIPAADKRIEDVLSIAYALESQSEHAFAAAIVQKAQECYIPLEKVSAFEAVIGRGVKAQLCSGEIYEASRKLYSDEVLIYGGSLDYIGGVTDVSDWEDAANRLSDDGKTPVLFSIHDDVVGLVGVADPPREEASEVISELHKLGIATVMITGDRERTADSIAHMIGVSDVVSSCRPEQKGEFIRKLQEKGKTVMVGDGINDAPALTIADVGIAMGAGSDVAVDAADVVIVGSKLTDLVSAVRLSRAVLMNIYENLFWAFLYNIICIPLAAGLFYQALGWVLNPMIAAGAMSISSVCVVLNALRLNHFSPYIADTISLSSKRSIDIHTEQKENTNMIKTIYIEGMMCPHCEAHTKKALEELDGVVSAVANHEQKKAVVTLSSDVSDEVLKAAVEGAGYTVTSIK